MRNILPIVILCSSAVFLIFNWYWMSKYFRNTWKNGGVFSSVEDCRSARRHDVFMCEKCKSKENKVLINKTDVPELLGDVCLKRAHLYGTLPRNEKFLTIAIPTVLRRKENYLRTTLESLLKNMDAEEHELVIILVLFADSDAQLRTKRAKETALQFSDSVGSGLLLLVQLLPEYYPESKITRRTFNDSMDRIKWRSKQVLDFAFLLNCSQNLSKYFLILEDDIIATKDYVSAIQKFVNSKSNNDWVSLTFSGFYIIGRLFRTEDLKKLSNFLLMFHLEKPVDLLIMQYLDLLVPSTEYVTRRIPGLFQHIGLFSSLDGKVQKAKDRSFSSSPRVFNFENPPADVVTTLKVYKKHYPESCYYPSNKFFWGSAPKVNDTFDVILRKSTKIKRIFINSGHKSHPEDVIKYAELQISPYYENMITDRKAHCKEFRAVAVFEKGKVDVSSNFTSRLEQVQCLRIEFTKKQTNWIIINEISIDADNPFENH
ncbi:alpha-1,3-mannosyl-glycoprotein 4-beta-N-acetylglucosaminyltransferase C-like [Stegodyphus dumicola]|uniref:alpha-1,3-mannosyl-glycoprotein 4-beta-N-acetylglucosaminyltransferase C-like n=1 Tax=Stegodyphus dumicola TaxID=202533 RepID=UPI0015A86536|nr:alpha-1,3-mannosyl-glycoprotein 4-beta-N-acetylglucosaminyltransferase C-like [Stegodyphus dumicola]